MANLPHRKSAPLPFVGQKRQFIRPFGEVLLSNIANDGEGFTIVDVFGGSGLLAHTAKRLLPKATVIYNDFDNYAKRLTHISDTNRLRCAIATILDKHTTSPTRNQKLSMDTKAKIKAIIGNFDGFIDVQTIASWLLFGGNQVKNLQELMVKDFYNRLRVSDYPTANDYLDGLVITHNDYLTTLDKYKDTPNCVLLLDPPYISTAQGAYAKDNYFGMVDFLALMAHIKPPFVFFGSTRSELLDYMDYLKQKGDEDWQRLGGFDNICIKASVNYNSVYEDNMLVKF